MAQDSFIEALLPAGFGRNERLERISGLIDWDRLAGLIRKVRPGETGRPPYAPLAIKSTWRTVDAIWYACGDTSTDLSFYSKRATLAAVYGATVLYWLDDSSEEFADTWAFLDRRIDDVMQIPKLRRRVEEALGGIFRPPPILRRRAGSS